MSSKGYVLIDNNDNPIGLVSKYAEMYAYDQSISFNITVANTYHALYQTSGDTITQGSLSKWTFNAGRLVDANITSEANTGGLLRIVCSAAHGLTAGDKIWISGKNATDTTDYTVKNFNVNLVKI